MKKKIVKQDIWIAPKRCPKMNRCQDLVAWDSFQATCNSDGWIFCSKVSKEARKYKRKPYEWRLIHEIGGFPEGT